MSKKASNVLGVFTESIGLYFSNFDKFMRYMTFPVLGQVAGLSLIFFITYFYSMNMPKLIDKYPHLNSMGTLILISILITLPGLAIFCKAFWEYLVAYGAVNSMFLNMYKSGKLYDFEAHTELIKRRAIPFIGLWFLFGIFSLFAVCPLFWVICGIFAVYFVLAFQVFTFEPELSPRGCVKKSLLLIKGHFASTFGLMALVGILTYMLIPQIIVKGIDSIGMTLSISNWIQNYMTFMPEINLEQYGIKNITHADIAAFIVQMTFMQIIIQYTLPLRSLLWANWYKELNKDFSSVELQLKPSSKKKKSTKRPSEKLMEATQKKYSSKKIDDNIIRRASEKDEG